MSKTKDADKNVKTSKLIQKENRATHTTNEHYDSVRVYEINESLLHYEVLKAPPKTHYKDNSEYLKLIDQTNMMLEDK